MAMNRREFTALIMSGLLFPQKLISAMVRPQLPAGIADDDHPQYYSFTFSCETPAVIHGAPHSGSLVVYDGVVQPYRAIGAFQNNPSIGFQPLLLSDANCRILVREGHLEACKPFATMQEFVTTGMMQILGHKDYLLFQGSS